ncbi:MAG: hypothetical protein ACLT38_04610 [Akkermansia sp.]
MRDTTPTHAVRWKTASPFRTEPVNEEDYRLERIALMFGRMKAAVELYPAESCSANTGNWVGDISPEQRLILKGAAAYRGRHRGGTC